MDGGKRITAEQFEIIKGGALEQQIDVLKIEIREQFAAELKARIEAEGMKRRQMYLYISEIKHLIDETIKAK